MAGNLTRRVTKKREEQEFFSLCMPPQGGKYIWCYAPVTPISQH